MVYGFKCHPGSLAQIVWCCRLGLRDLSKSPLLHILQLVSPLEPKVGVDMYILKLKYTNYMCFKSVWTIRWALTWLVLGVQSGSSSADS